MTTQANCVIIYTLETPGSDAALAFALSQSAANDISGNNLDPSALIIRPTFHASSSDYQASYTYKIKGITTDQVVTRTNLDPPVKKWDGKCSGSSSVAPGSETSAMTLDACNRECHASSTCYVIVFKSSNS